MRCRAGLPVDRRGTRVPDNLAHARLELRVAVAATQSCLAGPAKGDAEAPTEPNVGNGLGGVRVGEDPVDPPTPPFRRPGW